MLAFHLRFRTWFNLKPEIRHSNSLQRLAMSRNWEEMEKEIEDILKELLHAYFEHN